jgi:hypothetical protein
MVEDGDDKMASSCWQKNADGILIFVSLQFNHHITQTPNQTIVRFIFCCRRILSRSDSPRPKAKLPGHLRILNIGFNFSLIPTYLDHPFPLPPAVPGNI